MVRFNRFGVAIVLLLASALPAVAADVVTWKQQVAERIEGWGRRMSELNDQYGDTIDPAKLQQIQATMQLETNLMVTDVARLEVNKNADKQDVIPLPDFVKQAVQAKGIPISRNVSVLPDASWDFSRNALSSFTVTLTFRQ